LQDLEKREVKRIKILIVDDSAAVRDGLYSILSPHADIEIVGQAVDGHEAIAEVDGLHPDVVLMDSQMPEMDGIETTRCIKKHLPEIKILFLTVHTSNIEEALAAGADDYLMKDCGRGRLLKAIRELAAIKSSKDFGKEEEVKRKNDE
jgi:DNA-binding NarL/FixJ family response regulator